MAKGSFLQSLGLIFAAMACTDQTSDYRGRTAQPATQGEELDASASPTQNTQRPESATGPQTNPKPVVTPTPTTTPVPAPLNAAQASALVRGSCIFAGCHADGPTLMAAPSILIQLRDNLMPPPNQQRYTLRSADRAALLAYLQNRSPAALAD